MTDSYKLSALRVPCATMPGHWVYLRSWTDLPGFSLRSAGSGWHQVTAMVADPKIAGTTNVCAVRHVIGLPSRILPVVPGDTIDTLKDKIDTWLHSLGAEAISDEEWGDFGGGTPERPNVERGALTADDYSRSRMASITLRIVRAGDRVSVVRLFGEDALTVDLASEQDPDTPDSAEYPAEFGAVARACVFLLAMGARDGSSLPFQLTGEFSRRDIAAGLAQGCSALPTQFTLVQDSFGRVAVAAIRT